MIKSELTDLYNKFNKKYFKNELETKITIKRLSYKRCDHFAHYFPNPNEIVFFHWVMRENRDQIICTLLHEMVHANFRNTMLVMMNSPLVATVEYHNSEFAQKLYEIYKLQFSEKKLYKILKNEAWTINNKHSNMIEAIDYYGIQR